MMANFSGMINGQWFDNITPETQAYFTRYADVANGYKANNFGLSADQFAQAHWNNFGSKGGDGSNASAATRTWGALPTQTPTTQTPTTPQTSDLNKTLQELQRTLRESTRTPTTTAPVVQQVDPKSLVKTQVNDLLAGNSAYVQQAKSAAMQEANSRGLLNSSIASGAGVDAAIKSALPIASADAGTYAKQAFVNQDYTNQFLRDNNQFEQNRSLKDMDVGLGLLRLANDSKQANNDNSLKRDQLQLSRDQLQFDSDLRRAQLSQNDKQFYDTQKWQSTENAANRDFTAGQQLWQAGNNYIDKSLSTQSWMTDKIAAIQNSNIEDKQGAIAGIQDMAANMQASINAVYSKVPGWKQEWLAFASQGG